MKYFFRSYSRPSPGRSAAILALTTAVSGILIAAQPAMAWELRACADPDGMPQTNRAAEGYENKIVQILADDIGAELTYQWWTLTASVIPQQLREGNCDIVIGGPDGGASVISTIAYYRSPYAFVYRADEDYEIATYDDPILQDLRLATTTEGTSSHLALSRRGLLDHISTSADVAGINSSDRFADLIASVSRDEIDVAVPWGPIAGYYGARQNPPLAVVPVPEFDIPFTPMYHSIVIALRPGDEELRDLLDDALARRWDDIYAVLEEYNIPTLPLPRPSVSIEEQQP